MAIAATYEVQAHIPDNDATSWQVPYTIEHTNGSITATVDQYDGRHAAGNWVSLGVYHFSPGFASVSLTDGTGEGYRVHCYNATGGPVGQNYCKLSADAIRFIRMEDNGDWDSIFHVQNVSDQATTVTVTYYDQNGNAFPTTDSQTIAGKGRVTFDQTNHANLPAGFIGSAKITSSQPLIGIVNQVYVPASISRAATHNAIGGGSTKLVFGYVPQNDAGWSGSYTIQNLGNSPNSITVKYYNGNTGQVIDTDPPPGIPDIPVGGSYSVWLPDDPEVGNGVYSVVVTSNNGQHLGGIVNLLHSSTIGDKATSYNGDNQ